jgi:hypothetical protein
LTVGVKDGIAVRVALGDAVFVGIAAEVSLATEVCVPDSATTVAPIGTKGTTTFPTIIMIAAIIAPVAANAAGTQLFSLWFFGD